jgi:hypothetical protein
MDDTQMDPALDPIEEETEEAAFIDEEVTEDEEAEETE